MKINKRMLTAALVLGLALSLPWTLAGSIPQAAASSKAGQRAAGEGELDPTFGEGGLVKTDMNRDSRGNGMALQSDGKIVVAGNVVATVGPLVWFGLKNDFALTRYNSDGSLDASFGTNGRVTTDINNSDDFAYAVAIQEDGKIIAAGRSAGGAVYGDFCALARYNSNGSLDPYFGTGGKVTLLLSSPFCQAVALQADGKIIVAGLSFELARLNIDGSLDTTFGDNGIVETTSETYSYYGNAVILQEDDKIVLAGAAGSGIHGESFQLALARYNSDGSPDTTFGTNGIVIAEFPGRNGAWAVGLQPNFQIIVAGTYIDQNQYAYVALARFNNDGSLDTTFGSGGRTITDFGGSGIARAVAIQEDHKIVVAADNYGDFIGDFLLARYDENGNPDPAFGNEGKVITDLGGKDGTRGGLVQADGKIVLAGFSSNPLYDNIALARYNSDGSLDDTFGTGGQVITEFGGSFDFAFAMALQPDGKPVVAGRSSGGRTSLFSLTRYNSDGSPDDSFGRNGISLTRIADKDSSAYALAIQPDEKIVAAGGTLSGSLSYFDFVVARYTSDGSLDPSFGNRGVVITDFGAGRGGAYALALQSDGKITAAGWTISSIAGGFNYDFALARYESDGNLDASFGDGGKVSTDFNNFPDQAFAMAIQTDGKIVLAGTAADASGHNAFALARYNGDGTLDTTFGVNGKVSTVFSGQDLARAITLQEDGKILVAGDSNGNSILARYNSDGSLDTTFGNGSASAMAGGGPARVSVSAAGNDSARAVTLQFDKKILVAGYTQGDFLLARYNQDGTADTTFGENGRIVTDFGGNDDEGQAIALTGLRVLVAGSSNREDNYDFTTTRYWLVNPKMLYLPFVVR